MIAAVIQQERGAPKRFRVKGGRDNVKQAAVAGFALLALRFNADLGEPQRQCVVVLTIIASCCCCCCGMMMV